MKFSFYFSINQNPPSICNEVHLYEAKINYLSLNPMQVATKSKASMKSSTALVLTKSTHSHAVRREHLTRMIKFKPEATSISSTVHVRRRQRISRGIIGPYKTRIGAH